MNAPPAAASLAEKLRAHGWLVVLTPGAGTIDVQQLGPHRSDGTRPRLVVAAPCTSWAVRAHHPDGRALRAVWETHGHTAAGRPAWRLDMAWRGRRPDEHTPAPLRAAQLDQYIRTSGDQDVLTSGDQEMAA